MSYGSHDPPSNAGFWGDPNKRPDRPGWGGYLQSPSAQKAAPKTSLKTSPPPKEQPHLAVIRPSGLAQITSFAPPPPAGMEDGGVANGDHSPVVDLQDGEAGVVRQLPLLLL